MLNPTWMRLTWRKPEVMGRHQSPAATSGPYRAPRAPSSPSEVVIRPVMIRPTM
jgi:hypothetical protein